MDDSILARFSANSDIHVVGLAASEGSAILRLLARRGFSRLTVHDLAEGRLLRQNFDESHLFLEPERRDRLWQALEALPARRCLGRKYLAGIETAALVFVGQNWFSYPQNRGLLAARERGLPFATIMDLYFDLAPCPIVGVTGTNGKTTVVNLIGAIASGARRTYVSGNAVTHAQALDDLEKMRPADLLVLEISNRHLMSLKRSPHVAVLTNLAGDHFHEHGSLTAYLQAKRNLFAFQGPDDFAVVNFDDPVGASWLAELPGRSLAYSRRARPPWDGACLNAGRLALVRDGALIPLLARSRLPLPGDHNLENALAAVAAAGALGLEPRAISGALAGFTGVPQRIELVAEGGGVCYYDDRASTTPEAVLAALETLEGPVLLIAGGDEKGGNFQPLMDQAVRRLKALILLEGSVAVAMKQRAGAVPCHEVADLPSAVHLAARLAAPGDKVLMSPGGAFFHKRFIAGKKSFRELAAAVTR